MEEQFAQRHNNAAKFAFFYLLSLVALIFLSTSVGVVVFQIINKFVIDPVRPFAGRFDPGAIKFAISAIIIAAPIYYTTVWQINKNLFSGELDKEAGVRRWLSYLILFITSVVMIGWAIGTINSFLGGELSLKFALKALTSVIISGTVFSYYLYDIKREEVKGKKSKTVQAYFYSTLVVVVASLIASFFFVESPVETRNRLRDEMLLERFNIMDNAINSHFAETKQLPADLQILIDNRLILDEEVIKDPITGAKIEYRPGKDRVYELCGTFLGSNKDKDTGSEFSRERWPHEAGFQCLSQRVTALEEDINSKPLPGR